MMLLSWQWFIQHEFVSHENYFNVNTKLSPIINAQINRIRKLSKSDQTVDRREETYVTGCEYVFFLFIKK